MYVGIGSSTGSDGIESTDLQFDTPELYRVRVVVRNYHIPTGR